MLLPLHDRYLIRRIEAATHSEGGIALADIAQDLPTEGYVLSAGPGRQLDSGVTPTMQAKRGERILFQQWNYVPSPADEMEGLVGDGCLVAIRDEDTWRPCNDYVLIRPDATSHVDAETRATVQKRESGLLVACSTPGGAEMRERRRGAELYAEMGRLGRSQRYLEQPTTFHRHKIVHDFLDGLSSNEFRLLGDAIRREGNTEWEQYVPLTLPTRATCGTVLAVGPGFPNKKGERLGFAVQIGARVHWDKHFQAVVLDGLLAIPSRHLAAVETND